MAVSGGVWSSNRGSRSQRRSRGACTQKKRKHYLCLKMDPWLIPLSELNAPKMLREERRNTGGEEVVRKGGRPCQFSLPTGQCQFRDKQRQIIGSPMWVQIRTVSCSRCLLALRSIWTNIQDRSTKKKSHNQTARKMCPSPFHVLISYFALAARVSGGFVVICRNTGRHIIVRLLSSLIQANEVPPSYIICAVCKSL